MSHDFSLIWGTTLLQSSQIISKQHRTWKNKLCTLLHFKNFKQHTNKLYMYMVEILFFVWDKIINLLNFILSHIIQFCTRCKYWKVHRKKKNWVYNFTAKVNLLTKFYPLQNKIKKPNIYKYYNFNIIDIILLKLWKTLCEDVAYWV